MNKLGEKRRGWTGVAAVALGVFLVVWLVLLLAYKPPAYRWTGEVYTNDTLGLSFTLPQGWTPRDALALGQQADALGEGGAMGDTYQMWAGDEEKDQAAYIQVVTIEQPTTTQQALADTLAFYSAMEGVTAQRLEDCLLAGAEYGCLRLTLEGQDLSQYMLVRMAEDKLVNIVFAGGEKDELLWLLPFFAPLPKA